MILFGNTQNKTAPYNPESVVIGTQIWALKNFSESTLINGVVLPEVQNGTTWAGLTDAAWCNYSNNPAVGAVYGKLYNWYCCALIDVAYNPFGWRVPTQADFNTLITYLGGLNVAGKALKEAGTTHWNAGNTGDNSSAFTALGGGARINTNGNFDFLNVYGALWTSTPSSSINSYRVLLTYNENTVSVNALSNKYGLSIRLIKL